MLKKQRKGFSLIELIVAIAILATMLLVLTPATLKYVDESRTAKDLKTTADLTEVVESSLADDTVYQEITKYIIGKYKDSKMNYSSYIDHAEAEVEEYKESLGEDSYTYGEKARRVDGVRYMVGGKMRGITITFPVTEDKKIDYQNGRINEIQPGGIKGMANPIVLKDASPSMVEFIKNKFGKDVPITSATYRYSEFTIFIYTGPAVSFTETADSPMKVYGQWDGTNLIDVDRTVGTPDAGNVGGSGGGTGDGSNNGGGGGSVGGAGGAGGSGQTGNIITVGQQIPSGDIYITNVVYDNECHTCKDTYMPFCTCNAQIYGAGDTMPSTVRRNDIYMHGDYMYMYEQQYGGGGCPYYFSINGVRYYGFYNSPVSGRWTCGVKNKNQTSYSGEFLQTILGKPVTDFAGVYDGCSVLTGTVRIPSWATGSVSYAAWGCPQSLTIEIPCGCELGDPIIYSFPGTIKIYHGDTCGHSAAIKNASANFADNDWATIQAVTQAGLAKLTGWKIGDTKTIQVNGSTKNVKIIGFNHDGHNTITLMATDSVGSHVMNPATTDNPNGTNAGGWEASDMRAWLNNYIYEGMTDVKSYIKTVTKTSNNIGYQATSVSNTQDKVFLLSMQELGINSGTSYTSLFAQEGSMYEYFANNTMSGWGWTRTAHPGIRVSWYYKKPNNSVEFNDSDYSTAVYPAFVIG